MSAILQHFPRHYVRRDIQEIILKQIRARKMQKLYVFGHRLKDDYGQLRALSPEGFLFFSSHDVKKYLEIKVYLNGQQKEKCENKFSDDYQFNEH
jgi:hypothetical protein